MALDQVTINQINERVLKIRTVYEEKLRQRAEERDRIAEEYKKLQKENDNLTKILTTIRIAMSFAETGNKTT